MKIIKRAVRSRTAILLMGIIIGAIMFGGGIVAIAAGRYAKLDVYYNAIRIVIDGVEIAPKDANGNAVEPFISDGTTYLPVRAVSEALGKEVSWDGSNYAVYIGKAPVVEPDASVAERLTITNKGDGTYSLQLTGDVIAGKLANGNEITEENILAMLSELEVIFPDGTSWGDGANGTLYSYRSLTFNGNGGGCNSWAYMTAELLFGRGATYTTHNDLSEVKCGDVVRLYDKAKNSEHWVVVMGTGVDSENLPLFFSCEGNVSGLLFWSAKNYVKATENMYPLSTIYSFY